MIKCPKANCDGLSFHLVRCTPAGSNYELQAVCCAKCGAVVSFMDYYNIGAKLSAVEEMIDRIESKLRLLT